MKLKIFTVGVGDTVVHNSDVQVSFEIPEYTGQVDAIRNTKIN